jgi:hypothetical protein
MRPRKDVTLAAPLLRSTRSLAAIFLIATLLASCATKKVKDPPIVRALTIEGSDVCVDVPPALAPHTLARDNTYVDVVIGEIGKGQCVAGVEVYLAGNEDRPRDMDALRESVEHNKEAEYKMDDLGAKTVERYKRPMVTAHFVSDRSGLQERQWAFFVGSDPVVASFYASRSMVDCEKLEAKMLSSFRGHCGN